MLEFQLFRIAITKGAQQNLFDYFADRREILDSTVRSLPIKEIRKGKVWQLGNIEIVDNDALYCRVGRNSKRTLEVYEEGDFTDQEFKTAPYTHLIFELKFEICAIAKKTKLAKTTKGISSNLQRLLNQSDIAQKFEIDFSVKEIKDPNDFISYLKNAYSIKKFWTTFQRPNPFDVNDYIKPAQKLVEESNAKSGKTEIKGEDLNKDIIEDLSRSAASTGNKASARFKGTESSRPVTKRLGQRPVLIYHENIDKLKLLVNEIRTKYQSIRKQK